MMKFPFCLVISSIILWPLAAHGTIVTTTADEDDGTLGGGAGISLREAVNYSATGATITFDPTLSGQMIRLTGGQIVVAKTLTIDGSSLDERITLSGDKTGDGKTADDTRVLRINSGTVAIDSLIISGGYISGTVTGLQGGGIYNGSSGTCNLRNSIVSGNSSQYEGGGIFNGGLFTIRKCEIAGNYGIRAGAIFNGSSAPMLVEDSTISGNSAYGDAGGIWNFMFGTLTLKNSSLTNNSANLSAGGGIDNDGSFIVENSTIQGNFAKISGGGINNNGTLNLKNSTVFGNTADTAGGGIYKESGSLVINNTIVAGNTAPATSNISGTFTGSNNLTSGNPVLAPSGDYGGPTKTMPPLYGSPAINAGGATTLTTDQRGFARVSTPDIGAVEYQGRADLARFWTLDSDGDGSPYGAEQALGTNPSAADSASSRNLTAPTLDESGHAVLSFGLAPAAPGTHWILRRSADLLTFAEIYRYDGTTDTAVPGITFLRTATSIAVTDANPSGGSNFYRFEAVLEP